MSEKCTVCSIALIATSIFAITISVGLLAGGYHAIFNAVLHAKYQVVPGSEVEDIWENIPVPMVMRVYFFNVTNSDKFLEGSKPELKEMGPYVYREFHHKENLTFNENMTVTFYQKRWWTWDQEASGNSTLSDLIYTINPVPVSAAYVVEDDIFMLTGLNLALIELDEPAIVVANASDILFDGFKDPLLSLVQNVSASSDIPNDFIQPELLEYDKFAWFYKRNASVTYDGIFNMYTGESSIEDVGMIDWWDYTNATEFFETPCNTVNGSAGELWPPGVNRDFIQFYNPDLCMSVKLYYKDDIEDSYGIEGYRFWGSNRTFANASYEPENECFCIENICAPNGLLDVQTCRFGSPAFVSFPHFFNADPSLLDDVEGLNPDQEKHQFFIDINPDLGIPLRVAARMQINLRVKPYDGRKLGTITILKNVPDVILPIFWFEVLTEMTPELADEVKIALFFENSIVLPIVFTCTAIIGIVVLLFVSYRTKYMKKYGINGEKKMTPRISYPQ